MATNQDEAKLYDDLKGFLMASRTDLRTAATDAVLQQVLAGDDTAKIIQFELIPLLAKNCSYPDGPVAVNALRALVYLTSHGSTANKVVHDLFHEAGGMNRMIEIVLSSPPPSSSSGKELSMWKEKVNFAMSLIANMTRMEEGAVELAGRTMPDEAIVPSKQQQPTTNNDKDASLAEQGNDDKLLSHKPTLELIMARYLNDAFIEVKDYNSILLEENSKLDSYEGDPYQHFAAVLMNTTQVDQGRRFILKIHRRKNSKGEEEEFTILQKLLPQLKSINPIRRRGVAGLVRNCCIDRDFSWWLLNVVKITKHLLYPLAGPEELDLDEKAGLDPDLWLEGPDKVREPDHMTRLYLVESILLLLASARNAREQMRLERVYVILKWADMVEEQEDVSEKIYDCVNFLRRDEAGTEEGSSDKLVEETYNLKATTAKQIGGSYASEDFDDVD